MVYLIEAGELRPDRPDAAGKRVCVTDFSALAEAAGVLGEDVHILEGCLRGRMSKYESHERFDYLSVSVCDARDPLAPPMRLCAFLTKDALAILSDGTGETGKALAGLCVPGTRYGEPARLICACLDRLTADDYLALESIEREVTGLEEALLSSRNHDYCIREIAGLRRRLMALKSYYEHLIAICEGVRENENGVADKHTLRAFRLLEQRAARLGNSVLNLRDYVTQVREAYQAQVDIDLNKIMKVFTVITAIFLPLTLVAGWYGMNFKMPEYGWRFGYPLVIAGSLVVVAALLIYFKRKKWF